MNHGRQRLFTAPPPPPTQTNESEVTSAQDLFERRNTNSTSLSRTVELHSASNGLGLHDADANANGNAGIPVNADVNAGTVFGQPPSIDERRMESIGNEIHLQESEDSLDLGNGVSSSSSSAVSSSNSSASTSEEEVPPASFERQILQRRSSLRHSFTDKVAAHPSPSRTQTMTESSNFEKPPPLLISKTATSESSRNARTLRHPSPRRKLNLPLPTPPRFTPRGSRLKPAGKKRFLFLNWIFQLLNSNRVLNN